MSFLSNINQLNQSKSFRVASKAERAASEMEAAVEKMHELQQRIEKLSLCCQALWELLKDNTSLTEEDLAIKMTELDLQDGKLNGKLGKQILICPNCSRNGSSRRNACLYCGFALPKHFVFE